MNETTEHDYRSDLQCWFCLSYASFLTMPRVLMQEMSEEWQTKMAQLLFEYDDTFRNFPEGWGTRVQFTFNGKLSTWPSWVINYRYPDRDEINKLRASENC